MKKESLLKENNNTELINRMFAAGAHFGYSRTRRHPSVKAFIFGAKNRTEIIDLEKISDLVQKVREFTKELGRDNKRILFVGTKNEARDIIKNGAISIDMPYVMNRWIGGTLTNFSEIKKRIARLEELSRQRGKGEFAGKYTKKEQLMIDREISNLETNFGGLISMKELPTALFVIDTKKENTAVREAIDKNIPIIGLLSSDSNVTEITYPIVANDASRTSITFFVEQIVNAYKEGQKSKKDLESV
jgi:small subunit ribosomal protein S2